VVTGKSKKIERKEITSDKLRVINNLTALGLLSRADTIFLPAFTAIGAFALATVIRVRVAGTIACHALFFCAAVRRICSTRSTRHKFFKNFPPKADLPLAKNINRLIDKRPLTSPVYLFYFTRKK